jgi:hypothetical protein
MTCELKWKELEGIGRNWKELEGIGRNWKELEGIGRNWKELEGIGRNWNFCIGPISINIWFGKIENLIQ